ncbi:MAG: hypothetical protein U1E05_01590 [Patescibacteria group bacterium]|nr:hypothetical protein [Patescibacteria group bacterium]
MEAILIVGIVAFVIGVPVVLYVFARMSRKLYRCPSCGEELQTEYLDAKHCNMCGASLQERDR